MLEPRLRGQILLRGSAWTLIIGAFLGLGAYFSHRESHKVALTQARGYFQKDAAYHFRTMLGGGASVPPEQAFERQLPAVAGQASKPMDPIQMSHALLGQGQESSALEGHLTSLQPLHPAQRADAWEQKALSILASSGSREYWEEVTLQERPQLRYLGALISGPECLRCHATQAFQTGEVRGGISFTLPFLSGAHAEDGGHDWMASLGLGVIWLIGLGAILVAGKWRLHRAQERQKAAETLRVSEETYRSQFYNNADVMLLIDPEDGSIVDVNDAAIQFYGYERARFLTLQISDLNTMPPERIREVMAAILPSKGRLHAFEHRLADGSLRKVEVSTSRIHSGGHDLLHSIIYDITEHLLAEAALKDSEARFASINENAPGIIYRYAPGKGGGYYSPRTSELLGRAPEDLLAGSGHWLDLVHPEDQPMVEAAIETAVAGLTTFDIRYRICTASGQLRWFRDRAKGHWLANEGLILDGVAFDITEGYLAVDSLRESETNFRTFFETVTDLFLVGTPEGRILFANGAVTQTLGYTPAELATMNMLDLHPVYLQPEAETIFGAMVRGERESCPLPLQDKAGGIVPVETRVWLGKWNGVESLFGICKNLSAEQEAKQRFEKLFRNNPNPLALFTLDERRLVDGNAAWLKVFGFSISEVIDRTYAELGLGSAPESQVTRPARGRELGKFSDVEMQLHRKDGTLVHGLVSGELILNQGKQFLLTTMVDITELRRGEEERHSLQAQLQHAQKMDGLGTLAGGVAHDMNNVLGAILGLASAHLDGQPPGSSAHKAFATIIKACSRGGNLIKSLLAFARKTPAEECELDMNELVREGAGLLEHTTLAKIRFELELAEDLRRIRGDAGALAHGLMNLCVNAVDAMPAGGALALRTRNVDNDWIEVRVEDTGNGMPKEVLDKALDPFFTTKEVGKGTGLGLSLVYKTVTAHQGQMEIQSTPGHGTSVRLRFPAIETIPPMDEPIHEQNAATNSRRLTILLVDDDELIQSAMPPVMEVLGHDLLIASSGEEALSMLAGDLHPDVVILDMNMPGIGGAGTLPRLRALHPNLPVLLATGRADQSVLDLMAKFDAVTLLSKPFDLAEVRERIAPLGKRDQAPTPTVDPSMSSGESKVDHHSSTKAL